MLDHLSVLKASGGLDFLLHTKQLNKFLLLFDFQLVHHNTIKEFLYKVYMDNIHFVCVYSLGDFGLGSNTFFYHQMVLKLAYLASEQLNCEHLNG